MDDTYDQGVIAFAPIISVMAAIALHAIPAARARVARSDVGKLEQAFERAFQSIDVRARLVVAEIGNGPLKIEARSASARTEKMILELIFSSKLVEDLLRIARV